MDLNDLISSVDAKMSNVEIKLSKKDDEKEKKEKKPKPIQFEFDMDSTIRLAVKSMLRYGDLVKENPGSYELESRLIVKPSNAHKISTNIPEILFDQILNFYTKNVRHWKLIPWYSTFDDYFPDDIRRREIVPGEHSTGLVEHRVEWCEKKLFENSDWHVDMRPLSMRFSLKKEKLIKEPFSFARDSDGNITGSSTSTFDAASADEEKKKKQITEHYQIKKTCEFKDKFTTTFFSYVWKGKTLKLAKLSKPELSIEVESNNKSISKTTLSEAIIYNLVARTVELQGLDSPLSISEVKRR